MTAVDAHEATARVAGTPLRVRLDSLTGLRFVAALAVWFAHTAVLFEGSGLYEPWVKGSGFGAVWVSFFFCLSGFVLAWSARPKDRVGSYYRRRFARIYPAYLVALLAAVVVVWIEGKLNGARARSFGLEALLVQSWKAEPGSVNFVGWSLSVEAFFYLMFPLIIDRLRAASQRTRAGLLAGCLGATIFLQLLAFPGPLPERFAWIVDHAPPVRMLEFVAGILLGLFALEGRLPRIRLSWALGVGAVCYVLARALADNMAPIAILVVPFALVIAAAAAADIRGERSWLRTPAMIRLGEWSYAFYLVHQLAISGLVAVAPDDRSLGLSVVLAILGLGLGIAGSAVLYHVVERPLERRLRGGRPAPVPVVQLPAPARRYELGENSA